MKQSALLTTICLAVVLMVGCQAGSKTPTDNEDVNNTNAENQEAPKASPSAEEEKPTSNLKPEDINLDKPFPAEELNAAFLANEDAWKGKEVAIVGKYSFPTISKVDGKERIRVDVSDPKTNKKVAGCVVKTKPPEELKTKRENRVFKGTIREERYGRVLIEPCEFVK